MGRRHHEGQSRQSAPRQVKFDPAAPLRCWAVDVDLLGHTWHIPALPAADWIGAAPGGEDYTGIIPGLLAEPDAAEVIADAYLAMLDGGDDPSEAIATAARDAIEAATGVSWWIGERLMWLAQQWEGVGGELIRQGIDFARAPIGAVCVAVWRIISAVPDESTRAKLVAQIERPPAGVELDEDAASEAWLAFGDD